MDMDLLPRGLHLTMQGGTGGDGGQGGWHGGQGGVGQGPILNLSYGDKEEECIKIINWLSPINFFLRHAAISEMRAEGTGGWLLEHPVFKRWEAGLGNTLWCCGISGAGKTVLASMVVNYLSTQSKGKNTGVACIYLNHKEVNDQTPSRLLAGLWRQLVLHRNIGPIAEKLYEEHREKGTAPSLTEVVDLLSSSFKGFSQVFIVVDAMDEYPEFQREVLLQQLAVMGSNLNFILTSRPNISMEALSFPNLERLEIYATEDDLQKYVDAQIELSPRLHGHATKQAGLQEEIHSKINSQTVDGMFLLAKLHIQSLSTKNTIKAVREAIKKLPNSLHDSYDIAMQRIDDQTEEDRKTAHSTLIWVVNAKRPLTVAEITTALAIETGDHQLDEDNVLDIRIILSVCAGLVTVDKESSVVRLVHYTTQEYLDKIQAEKFPDAQTEITRTLLTFLAFDGYPDSSWNLEKLPPLAEYSQYCLAHGAGKPEAELREIFLNFLGQAFEWINTMNHRHSGETVWDSTLWNYPSLPSHPSALWIAAAANLAETTRLLLKLGPFQQNSEDPEIIVASYYGHKEIVSLLLENGADINAAGGYYESALQAAVARGHIKTVCMLLEKGADVNAAGRRHGNSLQAAAAYGHTEIVDILLKNDADVNAAGGEYESALQAAAAWGHTEIVNILLKKGADVNTAGGEYGSTFQAAVTRGHTKIVKILLEKGANVNAAGGYHGSSLQAAAAEGNTEIVDILLERGADVNAAGDDMGARCRLLSLKGIPRLLACCVINVLGFQSQGKMHNSIEYSLCNLRTVVVFWQVHF